jgi:predicted regulator of Ras-like GTPase activity (Roadblock/LC7/MglB family)
MATLKEQLQQMTGEMEDVITVGVVGMDGITVATHNPSGADTESFSAKFAMIMKLAQRSINELQQLGEFEENLVETENAWVLTRFLNQQYYLGIAVSNQATLGNVRMVASKYSDKIKAQLQ